MSASATAARAALQMALTATREEERALKSTFARKGVKAAAADFGGCFSDSFSKVVETAMVAAKREGVISAHHVHEGAVAGAARDALSQLAQRCMGWNVGGKIGIARIGEHLAVAMLLQIGLVHLDDIAVALCHRVVPEEPSS